MKLPKPKNILAWVGYLTLIIGAFYVISFWAAQKEAMEDAKGLWFALELTFGAVLILISRLHKLNKQLIQLVILLLILTILVQIPVIKLCFEHSGIPFKILDDGLKGDRYFTFYRAYSIINIIVIILSLLNIGLFLSPDKEVKKLY